MTSTNTATTSMAYWRGYTNIHNLLVDTLRGSLDGRFFLKASTYVQTNRNRKKKTTLLQ
jgi:hypothetical protein